MRFRSRAQQERGQTLSLVPAVLPPWRVMTLTDHPASRVPPVQHVESFITWHWDTARCPHRLGRVQLTQCRSAKQGREHMKGSVTEA